MRTEVKLSYPLVTTTAQVAVTDDLPVAGVSFLLGNDLTGGRVRVSTPTGCGVSEELGKVVPNSIGTVTSVSDSKSGGEYWCSWD